MSPSPLLVCFSQTVENVYDPLIYSRCTVFSPGHPEKPPAASDSQGRSALQQISTGLWGWGCFKVQERKGSVS